MLALWIIMGLVVFLAVASMLPFSLHVQGEREDSISYRTSFQWPWRFFGIGIRRDAQGFHIQLLCGNRCLYERKKRKKTKKEEGTKEKKEKEKTQEKHKEEKKAEKKGKKGFFDLLRNRDILVQLTRTALRFLRDLLLCLRRPRLSGDVEIGFGDPAAMGIISGFVYAVSSKGMVLGDLRIKPNYVDVIFTGEVDFSTGILPARVVTAFTKLLFRLPIIRLLKFLRRRRKAKKEKEVN